MFDFGQAISSMNPIQGSIACLLACLLLMAVNYGLNFICKQITIAYRFCIAAQRLQLASVYKGEAEKVFLVKKAEAEAEAKYLGGVGVARQRQAITDGLRENILEFSHKVEGTSAKEVMDLIMITQYFDTIKDLGNSSKNTTIFIPHGPGHVRDISDQIRNGMMEASSAQIDQ
jgi:hypothetical protein